MKVVINDAAGHVDVSRLASEFPELDLAVTASAPEVARELGDAEVLVASNRLYVADMVEAVNANAGKLRWIHFTTSGIDKALKNGGFPKGVLVTNSAGLRAASVAEHALALLLFLARRFRTVETARLRHDWIRDEVTPSVVSLRDRTLVILGLGAIGREVARKARAFDMRVVGVSRAYQPDGLVDEVYPRERAKEALAQADAVVVSLPSTPETRGFLDADKLSAMKNTAFVVNVSRGDLINEGDLIAACRAGAIAGAGLDVTTVEPTPADSPLWGLENVVLTPHIAGTGSDDREELYAMLTENLRLWLAGKPLARQVSWDMTAG